MESESFGGGGVGIRKFVQTVSSGRGRLSQERRLRAIWELGVNISFARALTETRLFFKLVLSTAEGLLWPSIWALFVQCCARHRVHFKPGRQFSRNRQQYRRKSRGLDRRRPGRKRKTTALLPLQAEPLNKPETLKNSKGGLSLLS